MTLPKIPSLRPLVVLALLGSLVGCGISVVPASPPSSLASATAPGFSQPVASPAPSEATTSAPSASAPSAIPSSTPSPLPPSAEGVVPILYYHRVEAVPAGFVTWDVARRRAFLAYDLLPAAFAAQLDWLVQHGYTTILPRDLAAHWDAGRMLPAKPVILTFDDGSPDWVTTVLPMLRQRGMVAEFYLTLDAIAPNNLHWSDVGLLARAGNGIGAHDVHHIQLAGLAGGGALPQEVMWREVNDIRAVIELNVGTRPDSMAYVGGGFNATLVRLVRRAGYTTARSILRGVTQSETDRFTLRVVRIGSHDDVVDPVRETLVPGLPTFTARMPGVSDLPR